jgi:choline kinase
MIEPTQAVILAAGRGSRLGERGNERPKCLTPVAGRALIDWTLDALADCGIHQTLLVGGWKSEALQGRATSMVVNREWAQTNMVASLRCATDWLRRAPTLVLYGDGAYGATALRAALQGADRGDIVVPVDTRWLELWSRRFANPLDDAETLARDGGRLLGIGERPSRLDQVDGQFMGLVLLSPAGWESTERWLAGREREGEPLPRLDMTGLLQRLLASGLPVHCTEVAGGWVEIDSQGDIDAAEAGLLEPGSRHDFRR